MAEARERRLQQFNSSIFGESQGRAVTPQPSRSSRLDYSPVPGPQDPGRTETNSFRSSVFKPPEPTAPRYNPHKPNDHYDADFYHVAPTVPLQKPSQSQFQPKYKYEQRVNASVYRENLKPDPVDRSARERKGDQLQSHILETANNKQYERNPGLDEAMYKGSFKWTDARSEMTKRDQRTAKPEERRRMEAASSVFGPSETQPVTTDVPAPTRPTDRNYSDLFGREFHQPKGGAKETLTPTSATWKDARFEVKSKPSTEDFSPSQFRDQQLRSAFDKPLDRPVREEPAVSSSGRPLHPQDMKRMNLNQADVGELPHPGAAQLDTFVINGLGPRDDVQTVRQLCQGLHVVSIETTNDDIKGTCEGQAKVVLRQFPGSDATERLRRNVAAVGLTLNSYTPDVKRKSHYTDLANRSFLDHQVELEARKPVGEAVAPHISKMKLLESSADVYGSSPGVGRWPAAWKDKPNTASQDRAAFSQAQQWEEVRKQRSPTPPPSGPMRPDSGFLQSTEASRNRWRG